MQGEKKFTYQGSAKSQRCPAKVTIYKATVKGEHIYFGFNSPTTLKSGMGKASDAVEARMDENSRLRNVKKFKDVLRGFLLNEAKDRGARRPWIEIVYCNGNFAIKVTITNSEPESLFR